MTPRSATEIKALLDRERSPRYEYYKEWRRLNADRIKKHRQEHRAEQSAYYKQWRAKNIDHIREYQQRNLERRRSWPSNKSPRTAEARRTWRKKNADKIKEDWHKWSTANRDQLRASKRLRYSQNRAQRIEDARVYREKHRDQINAARREYCRVHPGVSREGRTKWRARKAGAQGTHGVQEWLEKCELFAWCCAYCGQSRPLSEDHKIPLSRGGSDDISNILPACQSCNSKKYTKTTAEFLRMRAS
jgi:5-methylcytosine-specific restriction endonuclease McrA